MSFRSVKAIFMKNWYLSLKFERFLDITFWPVIDILVWAFVALYIAQVDSSLNFYALFLGSIFLWMMFMRATHEFAIYILEDFWKRTLHNLFASPLKVSDLVAGSLLFTLARVLITTVFLLMFTTMLLSFNVFALNWVVVALLYIPLIICGAALAFFLSGLFYRYGQDINVIAWALPWLFQPFSAVFYPVSSLPLWMQYVSRSLPMTYSFEGFRALLAGEPVARYLFIAYGGSIVLFLLCLWFFVASIKRSIKTGRLARS